MSDFEKAKQEQETRRKLWRERQKDRRRKMIKPKRLEKFAREEFQSRLKPQTLVQPLRTASGEIKEADKSAQTFSLRPTRILARLRAQRLRELREKRSREQKAKVKAGGAEEKVKNAQESVKRLKNIYRIINGTSAATLVGVIVTFLVMNAQLIFGNGLKLKIIPKLSFPEILIILFINFILFIAVIVIILLLTTVVAIITGNPAIKFMVSLFGLSI